MRAWGLGYLTDLITDSQPKSAIINRITDFRFILLLMQETIHVRIFRYKILLFQSSKED